MKKIAVLGDGGWGTALAILLQRQGHQVYLWSAFTDYARQLREKRENPKFLPGISIPAEIEIGADLAAAVKEAEVIVLAIPSQYMRGVCQRIKQVTYRQAKCFLSVAKGIEIDSHKRMSQLIGEEIPEVPVAVLSGPSHAEEVARGIPAAVVIASGARAAPSAHGDSNLARYLQGVFMSNKFRVYTSRDLIGVEVGGGLKNVIAIAVGICDGLGLGDNAKAALMTRGMAEIARLGVAMGGRRETFAGLAGIGDIIVTCISKYGRNLNLGKMIAQGKKPAEVLAGTEMVAEGVTTSVAAQQLGSKYKVELPITNEVYQVLHQNKPYQQAIKDLMGRAPKEEMEW